MSLLCVSFQLTVTKGANIRLFLTQTQWARLPREHFASKECEKDIFTLKAPPKSSIHTSILVNFSGERYFYSFCKNCIDAY